MERRVVVTGLGVVSPVGNNIDEMWASIKAGKHGIAPITRFDTEGHKVTLAAEVKDFDFGDRRAAKRLDIADQYALVAAREAVADSGIVSGENVDPDRFGIYGGTGIGGIATLESEVTKCIKKGNMARASALLVPMMMPNAIAGNISMEFNAKGPSFGIVSACASGTHTIGEAYRNIKHGYNDVIMAGGAESVLAPVSFSGFANMTAMNTTTDPDRASIPFDVDRNGFILGEGAGFLILEELEHAKARGAKIYGEIAGYGATSDAYHITSPDPEGTGAAKAIGLVIPELSGKLIGSAQRVPVPSGSITILDATLKDETDSVSVEGINKAMREAVSESFGYTDEEIVSSDVIGMSYGSLFDATQTLAQKCGTHIYEVRVVAWYDNEMSYVSQLIRTLVHMGSLL